MSKLSLDKPVPKSETFDPLSVENIGVTLAVELLEQPIFDMPPPTKFVGAGVYALYYSGPNPLYRSLVKLDAGRHKYPIYIGKASGENTKQGFNPASGTQAKLYDRIRQHAASLEEASGLDPDDFKCRFLILNDAYISLAESVMIRVFRPPWNGMSFGSKVVGGKRMQGTPSLWDSLHPGREGRPAGSEDRAITAERKINERIAELSEEITDPVVKRMYERIMKFV